MAGISALPLAAMAKSPKRQPPTQAVKQVQQVQVSHQKLHQGPLPAPEDLKRYDDLLAGGAERIFRMAEIEQQHRHTQESKAISSELITRDLLQATEKARIEGILRSDKRGQYLGATRFHPGYFGSYLYRRDSTICCCSFAWFANPWHSEGTAKWANTTSCRQIARVLSISRKA